LIEVKPPKKSIEILLTDDKKLMNKNEGRTKLAVSIGY
jgi:hypothetical protein